ncbi:hypothetical protein A6U86_28960 [Rhizobium sp. AC27/96]|nr:hypothetical protein A6U86_28960 [Rhizobium sp. AC27/96]
MALAMGSNELLMALAINWCASRFEKSRRAIFVIAAFGSCGNSISSKQAAVLKGFEHIVSASTVKPKPPAGSRFSLDMGLAVGDAAVCNRGV